MRKALTEIIFYISTSTMATKGKKEFRSNENCAPLSTFSITLIGFIHSFALSIFAQIILRRTLSTDFSILVWWFFAVFHEKLHLNPATRHDSWEFHLSMLFVLIRWRQWTQHFRNFKFFQWNAVILVDDACNASQRKCHLICVLLNYCWNISFHLKCNDEHEVYTLRFSENTRRIPLIFVRCGNILRLILLPLFTSKANY